MGKRCVVGGCSNDPTPGYPLFAFPSATSVSVKWDKFVKQTRLDWAIGQGTKYNEICALHFEVQDTSNNFAWRRGHQRCLRLEPIAITSIICKTISFTHKQMMCRPGTVPDSKFISALFS